MSAPMTKSQMAFELPKLSYIDTRWEEPAVQPQARPVQKRGLDAWIAAGVAAFRARRANTRALTELGNMSDRELYDVGLNRGDLDRVFDDSLNHDLRARGLRV
jgi:uncharacterized protein YjiS (DUF1127 family)